MPSFQLFVAPFILYVLVSGGLAYAIAKLVDLCLDLSPRSRMILYMAVLAVPVLSYASYLNHLLRTCSNLYGEYHLRICTIARSFASVLAPLTGLILGVYLCVRLWQHFTSPVRRGVQIQDDIAQRRISRLLVGLGQVKPQIQIYRNHYPAASIRGVWKPQLSVTTGLLELVDDEELCAVLAHELAHVSGKDNFFNLVFLLKELSFFSPTAHLAYSHYCQAREEAADAAVAGEQRLDLASALLKVTRKCQELVEFTSIRWSESYMTGGGNVARRIESLIEDPRSHTNLHVLVPLVLIGMIVLVIC